MKELNAEHLQLLLTREMPYGKYKGRIIADLPGPYLNWFARKGFPPGEIGKLLALIMTLCMAAFSVLLRRHAEVPMLPAMAVSAWMCSLFCFWFAEPMGVSSQDLLLIAAFGILQNAAGLIFYTLGSWRIPAAEATLLAALEVPLTPFWVWLMFSETPGVYTLIGGTVVLTALFAHILNELRGKEKAQPEGFQAAL